MPCYTIQTTTVELGSNTDPGLLTEALNSLGLRARLDQANRTLSFGQGESYDIATGRLEIQTSRNVAEIKRAYSHQIVQSQARKYGWQMKQVAENKYVVARR